MEVGLQINGEQCFTTTYIIAHYNIFKNIKLEYKVICIKTKHTEDI